MPLAALVQTAIDTVRLLASPVLPAWRLAALVVIVVVLLCRVVPLAIAGASHLARTGTPLVVSLLVLPEYALTSWCRDHRLRPLPGTYAFDGLLESSARIVLAVAGAAGKHLGRRRRIRWWPTAIVAALPVAFFYGTAALPHEPQTQQVVLVANSVQSVWLSLDGWVMTGDLRPCAQPGLAAAAATSAAPAPVAKPARSCVPTPRPVVVTPAPRKGR